MEMYYKQGKTFSSSKNTDGISFSKITVEIMNFEPHHQFTVAVQESGSCDSARTDCETVAEPGSNGLAFDKVNNNLLICQHGARSIIKIPLDPSDGMPLPEFDVSDYENQCDRKSNDR